MILKAGRKNDFELILCRSLLLLDILQFTLIEFQKAVLNFMGEIAVSLKELCESRAV